ncbi:hypothetical protein BY996DRAFT_6617183 [Phakopsora pachyrhizi]|nr:hypothetical protein BY996DRAFT_6617183 [Phakopsora pachyrhizi]
MSIGQKPVRDLGNMEDHHLWINNTLDKTLIKNHKPFQQVHHGGFRGIKDQQDYNDFIEDFSIILKYLIKDGQIIDEDEAGNLLINSLLAQLRRYNNEAYPIPPIRKIKILIENEIKFMKMLDSASIPKSPKVGKGSQS